MTLGHEYLLLALALVLLMTNCLGAIFTIRRNRLEKGPQTLGPSTSLDVSFGWVKIYGRLAIAQGAAVVLALGATAVSFSHSIFELVRSLF
jgi:hypothetical protein